MATVSHRYDCDVMRGTQYQHAGEREWFWANCVLDVYGGGVSSALPAPPQALHDPAAAFAAGYTAAGGPAYYLDHLLYNVIPCESSWNVYAVNPVGFYGLAQFLPSTWQAVGGGDWFSPYQQGVNTARLIAVADPTTQWPVCWRA